MSAVSESNLSRAAAVSVTNRVAVAAALNELEIMSTSTVLSSSLLSNRCHRLLV